MDKIRKDALSELVYDKIKQMVLDGVLLPGQKIAKGELAQTLGVSQTPVTEAINRLTGEGLIEQRVRQGFFVRVFTYADLRDLFAVRAGMEGIALRLSVEELPPEKLEELTHYFDGFSLPMDEEMKLQYKKADQAFHEHIISLSANSFIVYFDRSFDFIMKSYQKGLIREPEETIDEHRQIIQAIRARDGRKAQELLMLHHLKSRNVICERHLKSQP